MRFEADGDESFPGEWALHAANTRRMMRGRRGQAIIRRLRAALLALPTKRLVDGALLTPDGECCAIGALSLVETARDRAVAEHIADEAAGLVCSACGQPAASHPHVECPEFFLGEQWELEQDTLDEAERLGVPRQMAAWIAADNDEGGLNNETPEERYSRMLRWCERQLGGDGILKAELNDGAA